MKIVFETSESFFFLQHPKSIFQYRLYKRFEGHNSTRVTVGFIMSCDVSDSENSGVINDPTIQLNQEFYPTLVQRRFGGSVEKR